MPALPKQIISSAYSFSQFTPHLFNDDPVSGELRAPTRRRGFGSRDGADFNVPFDLFLCQECSQPRRIRIIVRSRAWGLTRAQHNHSRFDLSISCVIRLLRKQGALLRCSHDVCMSVPSRLPSIRSSLTCSVLQHLASPASHSMHPSFGIDREWAVAASCAYTIRCWLDGTPLGHRICLRKAG